MGLSDVLTPLSRCWFNYGEDYFAPEERRDTAFAVVSDSAFYWRKWLIINPDGQYLAENWWEYIEGPKWIDVDLGGPIPATFFTAKQAYAAMPVIIDFPDDWEFAESRCDKQDFDALVDEFVNAVSSVV